MLTKKARRQRALSVPTDESEKLNPEPTQRNSQSASAISKYKSFFTPPSTEGNEEAASLSAIKRDPETPSSSNFSNTGYLPSPKKQHITFSSEVQQSSNHIYPTSSTGQHQRTRLVSPCVFNFYELSPTKESYVTEQIKSKQSLSDQLPSGSKSSPIVLTDEFSPDVALRTSMSSKGLNVSVGNKLEDHFICNICNKSCGSQSQLIVHLHCHKNSCPICPETFPKKELLQTHMLQHCPNSEHYICNIENCNKRFNNAVLLQKHIEQEHVVAPSSRSSIESPRPHRLSESSDWSPLPQQSPSSPGSFRTPTSVSTWRSVSESPGVGGEFFRSPSSSITSPMSRRSIGSEGGPFKPYRSPGIPSADWRPSNRMVEEQVKYLQGLRDATHITQLLSQQVFAQQHSLSQNSPTDHPNKKQNSGSGSGGLLFEHHIVKSQQQPYLQYRENRSITVDLAPSHILAPQPIKHNIGLLKRRHTSSESSAISTEVARVMTPEPSPSLPDGTKPSLLSPGNVFVDVDTQMGGLELLGQVSSQLSKLNEGDPVRPKQKPAPLEMPQDTQFALTPPYTGTPRYLWTPTKPTNVHSSFFSANTEPPKIRIGEHYQALIPDLQRHLEPEPDKTGVPLYTPPRGQSEVDKREKFFQDVTAVYPDTEYLHHCVHMAAGDLDKASKLARCPIEPKFSSDLPLHKYRYNNGWRWSQDDQERFLLLFQRFGKNLSQIAKWIPDKRLSDVVEYYYFWKKRYPDIYKQYKNQQQYRQIQPMQEQSITYESRAQPKTPRSRSRKEVVYFETEAYTSHDSKGNKEIKFRQKKVVNPYMPQRPRNKPAPQPLGSYKCKVCGKEFQKVKSRSAHMKTHKRQQNTLAAAAAAAGTPTAATALTSLQQQQYLQQQQQQLHHQIQQHQQIQQHIQQQQLQLAQEQSLHLQQEQKQLKEQDQRQQYVRQGQDTQGSSHQDKHSTDRTDKMVT